MIFTLEIYPHSLYLEINQLIIFNYVHTSVDILYNSLKLMCWKLQELNITIYNINFCYQYYELYTYIMNLN